MKTEPNSTSNDKFSRAQLTAQFRKRLFLTTALVAVACGGRSAIHEHAENTAQAAGGAAIGGASSLPRGGTTSLHQGEATTHAGGAAATVVSASGGSSSTRTTLTGSSGASNVPNAASGQGGVSRFSAGGSALGGSAGDRAGATGRAGASGASGATAMPLPFAVTQCIAGHIYVSPESLSFDGRWFVYEPSETAVDGVERAVLLDRQTQLERVLFEQDRTSMHPPIISGNGTRVAWHDGQGNWSEVTVLDLATNARVSFPIGDSFQGAFSFDGRYLAFTSRGPVDTIPEPNSFGGIVVVDLPKGLRWLASVPDDGQPADDYSSTPDITDDGELTVFQSVAMNLVSGKPSRRWDVYLHDHAAHQIRLAAPDLAGTYSAQRSWHPRIAANGSVLAVTMLAAKSSDSVPTQYDEVCIFSTTGARLRCLSELKAHGNLELVQISADGRFVLLSEDGDSLVQGDANGTRNAIVYDRALERFELVGLVDPVSGTIGLSAGLAMSGNGSVVAFATSQGTASSMTSLTCLAERKAVQ